MQIHIWVKKTYVKYGWFHALKVFTFLVDQAAEIKPLKA